jgi:hypothetical protein
MGPVALNGMSPAGPRVRSRLILHIKQKRLRPGVIWLSAYHSVRESCGLAGERAANSNAEMSAFDPNGFARYAAAPTC